MEETYYVMNNIELIMIPRPLLVGMEEWQFHINYNVAKKTILCEYKKEGGLIMISEPDCNTWKKVRLPKIIKEAITESSIMQLIEAQELKYSGDLSILDGSNYELKVIADGNEKTFIGDELDMSMNPIADVMVQWAERIMQK